MSDASSHGTPASSGGGKKLSLEAISQAFQQELEAGRRPKIEKVLSQLKEKYHERVLRNLMIAEIGYQRRAGKSPQQTDYQTRFPEFAETVAEVFEFLGPVPFSKPLPSALRSSGSVSMIVSQSALNIPIPVDENSAVETSTDLKRTPVRQSDPAKCSGDTASEAQARTKPGKQSAELKSIPAAKEEVRKSSPGSGVVQKSNSAQRNASQPGAVRKSPDKQRPAAKPATPVVEHYDDDLNSLLSVQLPQEPLRVQTAEEQEEAQERLERRKARQRKKDREKRLQVKVGPDEIEEQDNEPKVPLGEFQLPLIVAVISSILNLAVALMIAQSQFTLTVFLILKAVILIFSFAATLAGLFVAAFLLGTQYGYLHTAILKIAAICLTQGWIVELHYLFPLPFFFFFISCFVTYLLFEAFFELDTMDAIYSVVVVCCTRFVIGVYLVLIVLQLVDNNPWLFEKAEQMQQQEEERKVEAQIHNQQAVDDARTKARKEREEAENDKNFGEIPGLPVPQVAQDAGENPGGEQNQVKLGKPVRKDSPERVDAMMKFSHQFANLVILEEFEAAYDLMSQEYHDETSLADFKTRLIDWRNANGYPIGAKEFVESIDENDIQQRMIAEDLNLPNEKILALIAINFSIDEDFNDQFGGAQLGEEFLSRVDVLLIEENGKMKIAEFGPGY